MRSKNCNTPRALIAARIAMELLMDPGAARGFKSPSQIARLVTEAWGAANLYCAACESPRLRRTDPNTRVIDYRCTECGAAYQMKSSKAWSETRVPDAGYRAMMDAISAGATPNLLIMQYSAVWRVVNLLLVPSFFFTASAIEKRPPLSLGARRAGWVGCNILLSAVAPDGKLPVVQNGRVVERSQVRDSYQRLQPLSGLGVEPRGWTLDVLRVVRSLDRTEFSLSDVYELDADLARLHPENRNVRPKIRQQLQTLRDLGLIVFRGNGRYSMVDTP